jgi:hypothetical protein
MESAMDFRLVFILILSLGIISCSESQIGLDDDLEKSVRETWLLPLEESNNWNYQVTEYDAHGEVINSYNHQISSSGEQLYENNLWFQLQDSMLYSKYVIYGNTPHGVMSRIDLGNGQLSHARMEFPYRAETGEEISFPANDNVDPSDLIMRKLQSVSDTVTTPAGNFKCYRYSDKRFENNGEIIHDPYIVHYYSPGTGLIKREYYSLSGNHYYLSKIIELIDFRIYNYTN